MAQEIDKLTESHFALSTCKDVEKYVSKGKKCLIYFGDRDQVFTGDMKYLNTLAGFDSLHFPED